MGKTTLYFPPNLPSPLPQKRKLFCQQIHGLPIYRPSQREAVEKKTGGNMILASPESSAFLYLFTKETCEISSTTVTVSMRN